jgi:hypothetical protein
MIFGYVILAVAVTISLVAAYYSIMGLTAIFAAAVVPIIIMGGALELGKIVSTVWLHNNWRRVPFLFKAYLVPAVAFLMFLTSMGIFGFLSKAHTDQALVSGDVQAKIAIYDEKIKIARDNIEANRKALKQMDEAVDQTMARSSNEQGADRAVAIRRSQNNERQRLLREIEAEQKKITGLQEQAAPIRAEVRKVEAEVGPIKYIAALVYDDQVDTNILEKAVRWVIILIVIVFDPLALCLILAANKQFEWAIRGQGGWVHDDPERPTVLDKWTAFFKKEPLKEDFDPRPETPKEPEVDLDEVNRQAADVAEEARVDNSEGSLVVQVPEEEEYKPFKGAGVPPAMPMMAAYQFAEEKEDNKKEIEEPTADPFMEDLIMAKDPEPVEPEKPVEAVAPVVVDIPNPRALEAAPGLNRGVMFTQPVQADNTPKLGKASNTDFGSQFPAAPEKGDVYLRTDYLPNRLFKYNGKKWIEVDKNQTDVYAYNEMYIKYLIEQIDSGNYDVDTLSEVEREQISQYLDRNA